MAKKKIDEKAEKSTDKNLYSIAKQQIIKTYGEGVIALLGDHADNKVDVISTGCLSLDVALGIGGFARGRIYEAYGPNSSGKSTLALSVCMNALMQRLEVVYVDAEHAVDPKLVANMGKEMGVNPDRMLMVQAFTGDDNLDIAEKLMKTGMVDVIVIDSVSALLPKNMAEGEIGDNYIGLLARLMSKACLKLMPVANYTNTMIIFVNQIRHSIGKWGDDRTPTGGEALPFYATGRIKVEGGEAKQSRIADDNGEIIGHECKFEVVKNKLSKPWMTAKIDLIYGYGYNFVMEVVNLAITLGFIEQAGAWFSYAGEKYQGKPNLVSYFRENKEIYEDLRVKVKHALGLE